MAEENQIQLFEGKQVRYVWDEEKENWINQRIKTIEIRKGLTDEWQRGGMNKTG